MIQRDRYKLLIDQNEIHLSNLDIDPNETTNIAGDEPDLTATSSPALMSGMPL